MRRKLELKKRLLIICLFIIATAAWSVEIHEAAGTTAAAFLIFSQESADFLILETGLGGRLDATNAIDKSILDIITPISAGPLPKL